MLPTTSLNPSTSLPSNADISDDLNLSFMVSSLK